MQSIPFSLFVLWVVVAVQVSRAAGLKQATAIVCAPQSSNAYVVQPIASSATPPPAGAIAVLTLADERNASGWIRLNLTHGEPSNSSTPCFTQSAVLPRLPSVIAADAEAERYYAAGYLEAAMTHDEIYDHFMNTVFMQLLAFPSDRGLAWIAAHIEYMNATAATQLAATSGADFVYWRQVYYALLQLRGLADGYAAVAPPDRALSYTDIFLINFAFELEDVAAAVSDIATHEELLELRARKMLALGGCSAMVKVTPDNCYVMHTTWTDYAMMLRFAKKYSFAVNAPHVTFSSYAATIHSGDDFYSLSSGLVATETTIDNHNISSLRLIVPQCVSEFIRVVVSNALARSGAEWATTFSREKSGTYCNCWIVVDMKRIGSALPLDGVVTISEQMPGVVISRDVTADLRRDHYIASYNVPRFREIYDISETARMFAEYGDYFSFSACPRARIFARNASDVTTIEAAQRLIRYNNWRVDPLSAAPTANCTPYANNPRLAISARADLVPAGASWGKLSRFLGSNAEGGIDGKVTSYSLMKRSDGGFVDAATMISGPTSDQQPVFQWSRFNSFWALTPHRGQPDRFNFSWIHV